MLTSDGLRTQLMFTGIHPSYCGNPDKKRWRKTPTIYIEKDLTSCSCANDAPSLVAGWCLWLGATYPYVRQQVHQLQLQNTRWLCREDRDVCLDLAICYDESPVARQGSIAAIYTVLSWSLCGGAHRLAVSEWEAPEAVSNCLQKFISVEPHPHNCGQVCVGPHFCVWQAQNTLLSDTQSWKYAMEEGPNCLEWKVLKSWSYTREPGSWSWKKWFTSPVLYDGHRNSSKVYISSLHKNVFVKRCFLESMLLNGSQQPKLLWCYLFIVCLFVKLVI